MKKNLVLNSIDAKMNTAINSLMSIKVDLDYLIELDGNNTTKYEQWKNCVDKAHKDLMTIINNNEYLISLLDTRDISSSIDISTLDTRHIC